MPATSEQLRAAAALGQARRQECTRLLHGLASGDVALSYALHQEALHGLHVVVVVAALPWRSCRRPATRSGKAYAAQAEQVLERAGISPWLYVGRLTARQRRLLNGEWRATRNGYRRA